MKINILTKLPMLAVPLAIGALTACGPDKDNSPGDKAEDAVNEAGENVEEATEEVDDEVDDATDDQ